MEIKLRNIGIVRNAFIKLDGLTVITGKNESGKTTVGKALYALLNAVSDLKERAEADRVHYILDFLFEKSYNSLLFDAFSRLSAEKSHDVFTRYPSLVLISRSFRMTDLDNLDAETFAHKVEAELSDFRSLWETDLETALSDPMLNAFLQKFKPRRRRRKSEDEEAAAERNANEKAFQIVRHQIMVEQKALQKLFLDIDGDPELLKYVRVSANRSFNTEFSGQIQPVNRDVKSSMVELKNDEILRCEAEIQDNQVIKYTFHDLQIKKAYFVDTPSVLEETDDQLRGRMLFRRRPLGYRDKNDMDSFFNPGRVQAHATQLRAALTQKPSVLKETILDENLSQIQAKINAVVSGEVEFSPKGNDYITPDKNKLRVSNMAAGSKMFSIIKRLLRNGLLDKSTMLILDEPEIHLHPQWQNQLVEIIALLVKELRVNVLLTTHSPNFVLAIDAYMRKYGIEDITNFYQARRTEDGYAEYECVNDKMQTIYQDFLDYLSEMRVLRDSYDNPGEEWEWDDEPDENTEGGDGKA